MAFTLAKPSTFEQNISVNVKVCNTLRRHLCKDLVAFERAEYIGKGRIPASAVVESLLSPCPLQHS